VCTYVAAKLGNHKWRVRLYRGSGMLMHCERTLWCTDFLSMVWAVEAMAWKEYRRCTV